jgi:hypothetical protein
LTVLRYNLLERWAEVLPPEDLDILLDISRFGVAECHDYLEELLAFGLSLTHGEGMEALQIPSDPVLFLNSKSGWGNNELFQEVDSVH